MTSYLEIMPVLILAGGGLLVFCVGAFFLARPPWLLFLLSLLSTLGAGFLAILLPPDPAGFLGLLDVGEYARFFTVLIMVITSLTLLLVHRYSQLRGFSRDEFYALLLFAALGMVLVASARHWLIFFLGLELLSISLYVIIPIRRDEAPAQEAGVKYFIMGAVASAFLTFGLALLYGASGTLDIPASLRLNTPGLPLFTAMLALSLILVGIGFKTSLVPFHLWTPDVYEGAPAPVTAFLSSGSKVALFAALIRLALHLGGAAWEMAWPALWLLAVLTMAVGNITALYQRRVKRLLAYSAIAQMGYLLMALVAVKQGSLPALLFYLTVYAVMDLGAFGLLGSLSGAGEDVNDLADLQGLGYSHPWRSAMLAVCLFSLVGLPPTGGFLGKLLLFRAVLQADFILLAVIGIIAVMISIYVYFKVLVTLYMHPAGAKLDIPPADPGVYLAGAVIAGLIFWLGLMPAPFLAKMSSIAGSFFPL